jgi:hypothetical protein
MIVKEQNGSLYIPCYDWLLSFLDFMYVRGESACGTLYNKEKKCLQIIKLAVVRELV